MEKTMKRQYESPQLTVVRFRTERGYAISGTDLFDFHLWQETEGTDQMEEYTTGNGWNQGSNHFWD